MLHWPWAQRRLEEYGLTGLEVKGPFEYFDGVSDIMGQGLE